MGDLNAPADEPTHAVFERRQYASAYKRFHGREPAVTWPSGLQAPLMDTGEPHCADYIYVYESPGYAIDVVAADLRGDQPPPEDPTLYPSDHIAVNVRLRIMRKAAAAPASS